jgi:hypothetical protein
MTTSQAQQAAGGVMNSNPLYITLTGDNSTMTNFNRKIIWTFTGAGQCILLAGLKIVVADGWKGNFLFYRKNDSAGCR